MRAILITCISLAGLWPVAALAQTAPNPAQVERNAVDLKQGMTPEEVRQLLGKPRRTSLRGGSTSAPWQGTLQWTYVWTGSATALSGDRSLQIEFAAKAADQWFVNSWGWSSN